MKVLVCGGRGYCEWADLCAALDALHAATPITLLIHGGAAGADAMAANWAAARRVPTRVFAANWRSHGRGAGPIRNAQMLAEGQPDLVVAFPGGRGTADLVHRATLLGVEVRLVA